MQAQGRAHRLSGVGGLTVADGAQAQVESRSLVAALPIGLCMMLPLVQLGGVAYLYDLAAAFALWVLGFPRAHRDVAAPIRGPLLLLALALVISAVAGVMRSGSPRPVIHAVQFGLTLAYGYSVYLNAAAGLISAQRVARWVLLSAAVTAGYALLQYGLMLVNRPLGERLYLTYLNLAGISDRFFTARYMRAVEITGVVRAMGTWDVATTFGGMLALALGWLQIASRGRERLPVSWIALIVVAILATNSRHAWIIGLVALAPMLKARFGTVLLGAGGAAAAVALLASQTGGAGALSLTEQVVARVDRTVSMGLSDSSIQARYVDGTRRFAAYAARDPAVLLTGLGINTEKAIFEKMDRMEGARHLIANQQFGFVSNGWLLVWRNLGILGLLGLVGLFLGVHRVTAGLAALPLLIAGLVIVADNYAIQAARCFFMVVTFICVAAGGVVAERLGSRPHA